MEINTNDGSKSAKNWAKDQSGEWSEEWSNKNFERWAGKNGKRGGQEWHESWYKKVKTLRKLKDEEGNELSGDDSDGSEIEE